MISKSEVKIIASLKLKKFRAESGQFIVEGEKSVSEAILSGWKCERLIINDLWAEKHELLPHFKTQNFSLAKTEDLERMTQFSSPPPVLAVMQQQTLPWTWRAGEATYVLALDRIKDPGNLGTIIRIAEWFGMAGVACSLDTVELWNAKTIQASMGSIFRMPVLYGDLASLLQGESTERIYATSLQGADVRNVDFAAGGALLIGSESFGLSDELLQSAGQHITIPSFGPAESLNAAVATGIVCSWLRKS